ncbi:DUF4252 domain-containing protein [Hymenobacter cavernae]|uniref:DUF4252 domain-containing protein n=1 Tax=Hymenobacter cavernae TaxID=2044852 RepID=A0ABQ1TIJ5_9BACT|nr:DUF4252 domain-containing protein [Hymenobacter cavernae]GGE95709.1 hypothetical protein GCM10011383_03090 [Hymenobacter cavernae]
MKLRLFSLFIVLGLLAASCRTGGPGRPAKTVAAFFNKYQNRPGFRTTDWSAGLTTRLLLGRLGKLGGDNDISQALTAVRSVKILTFTPTSVKSEKLVSEGLLKEVDGLLSNERYTPLAVTTNDNSAGQLRYSTRQQGDRVQELVATGNVQGAPDSFMLVSVAGDFTKEQLNQFVKFLPSAVSQITK